MWLCVCVQCAGDQSTYVIVLQSKSGQRQARDDVAGQLSPWRRRLSLPVTRLLDTAEMDTGHFLFSQPNLTDRTSSRD